MESTTPMEVENTTTIVSKRNQNLIKDGDNVILDINNGEKFAVVKVKTGSKTKIGRKQISVNAIIGEPYYTSFQVINDKNALKRVTQKELDDMLNNLVELNQNEADNRNLDQNNTAQKLTQQDITDMKDSGTDSNTIIKTIVENSASFQQKTSFSQLKYLKKKIKKYSTIVKVIKPTLKSLTEAYYKKNSKKICGLRFDTFGQLLTMGNIRANSQVLVVETCMGLVTGSIAERMNGDGTILSAYIGNGPSLSIVNNFGFETDVLNTIYPFNLNLTSKINDGEDISNLPAPSTSGLYDKVQKDKKKQQASGNEDGDNGPKEIINQRNDTSNGNIVRLLKEGVWSLIVVTKYSPLNILLSSWPFLNSSGSFVVYCQFQQPLVEINQFLHKNQMAINLQISEIWMREHQVLPKRTHPMMSMDGASGYLLCGTKVVHTTTIPTTTTTTTTTTTPPKEQSSPVVVEDSLNIEKRVIDETKPEPTESTETEESLLKKRKLDE